MNHPLTQEPSGLRDLVFSGQHQKLVQSTIDHSSYSINYKDIHWIIASLSFIGRLDEAEGLAETYLTIHNEIHDAESFIVSRFFLGIGFCRARRIKESRKMFVENLKFMRRQNGFNKPNTNMSPAESALLRFFVYQGLAFFRYTTGNYRLGQTWVRLSNKHAAGSGIAFAMSLASELKGHFEIQNGQISSGLRQLSLAKSKAQLAGLTDEAQAFESSIRLYEATLGLKPAPQIVQQLRENLVSLGGNDTYSKASIAIALAKALVLSGQIDTASEELEKISRDIYQFDNPYLESLYNLTLANIQYRKGAYSLALTVSRTASARRDERQHLPLKLKSLGLQKKILEAMGLFREQQALAVEIEFLTRKLGGFLAERIKSRHELSENKKSFPRGEDPLGDLIDDVSLENHNRMSEIFRLGWHLLLVETLHISPEAEIAYLDLDPNGITLFSKGNVTHLVDGCSDLIRKALLVLGRERHLTKESLTEKLWGQPYKPLRHDNLIYGLIARIRKLLGKCGWWIEASEQGYSLHESVSVKIWRQTLVQSGVPANSNVVISSEQGQIGVTLTEKEAFKAQIGSINQSDAIHNRFSKVLNLRQIKILEWSFTKDNIQPKDLMNEFRISDATVTRDLTKMVEISAFERHGQGRATYYTLRKDFSSEHKLVMSN